MERFTSFLYEAIQSSLAHFIKSVRLNGGQDFTCDLLMERETFPISLLLRTS